ncbi:MAG TPA: LacI family transcriptional regulator [Firmicutes bacterium]|jgi:ribose transport system substrate-binding protein|nr:LacI family transcriptional regulator [Bacillota bacterium]
MKKNLTLLIICLLSVVVTIPGVAAIKNAFAGNPKEEYYMVSFVSGIEYWKGCFKGMTDAATLLGVKAIYTGAPQADVNQEATVLEQVIAKKPAGIAITCANPDGLKAPINKAIAAGIPVVTFDADSPASNRYCYLGTSNYNAGATAARYLAKLINGSGAVAVSTVTGQLNHEQRKAGFIETLAVEYPNIKVVATGNDNNDQTKAATLIAGFIQGHPGLKGVFCTDALGGVGSAIAVREANQVGKVKIVSFDTDRGTLDLIKEGAISASIAQGTWNMGYWSLMFLYNTGHNLVKPVDGWKTKGINPLPGIVDTGANVVTKANVDAFYSK